MLDKIQNKIKELHGIDIGSWEFIDRPYAYPLFTGIGTDVHGNQFFVKESKNFVPAHYLEELYLSLESITDGGLNICYPLKDKKNKYGLEIDSKVFHVFNFYKIKDFGPALIKFTDVFSVVDKFHKLIEDKNLPSSNQVEHLDFKNWLLRPLVYLPPVVGDEHPFVLKYREFCETDLPKINFVNSNIFWDISKENFCLDDNLNIWLLDFELVHNDAVLADFIRAAGMYIEVKDNKFSLNEEIFNLLRDKAIVTSTISDDTFLRFLLVRSVLRNVRGVSLPEQKKDLDCYLLGALDFILGK